MRFIFLGITLTFVLATFSCRNSDVSEFQGKSSTSNESSVEQPFGNQPIPQNPDDVINSILAATSFIPTLGVKVSPSFPVQDQDLTFSFSTNTTINLTSKTVFLILIDPSFVDLNELQTQSGANKIMGIYSYTVGANQTLTIKTGSPGSVKLFFALWDNQINGFLLSNPMTIVISPSSFLGNCNDGIDNDADGLIDFEFDLSCAGPGGVEGNNPVDQWTDFTPSTDTKFLYISSSSGTDSNNNCQNVNNPCSSIAHAYNQLSEFRPDWVLLKRGDSWNESLGNWKKSGRSQSEPLVIGSYGISLARPRLNISNGTGLIYFTNAGTSLSTVPELSNLALVGIHFKSADPTSATNGLVLMGPSRNILIEDCLFEGFDTGISFQAWHAVVSNIKHHHLAVRYSQILDSYQGPGNSQGFYAWAIADGLLLEGNVFDRNGKSNIFEHNAYVDNAVEGFVAIDNIFARAGSHGLQARPGGTVIGNLFIRNPIALLFGGGNNANPGGVSGTVAENVILEGTDINAANPRGFGIDVANIVAGCFIARNLLAHNFGGLPIALNLQGDNVEENGQSNGVHHCNIEDNRALWGKFLIQGDHSKITDIGLTRNHIQISGSDYVLEHYRKYQNSGAQLPAVNLSLLDIHSENNRFSSSKTSDWVSLNYGSIALTNWMSQVGDTTSLGQKVVYPDPTRSVGPYNAMLGGGGTYQDFLNEVRKQSKANWNPNYSAPAVNDWIRAGFGM